MAYDITPENCSIVMPCGNCDYCYGYAKWLYSGDDRYEYNDDLYTEE